MRPTGDRAGLADLPGRPDVNRATVALHPRRRCYRGVSPTRGPGRMDRGVDRPHRRRATVGGIRSTPPRSTRCRWTAPRRSSRRGPCCGLLMCARRSRADGDRRRASRLPRSRRGAHGAPRRSCLSAEAQLLLGDSERAAALFVETSRCGGDTGQCRRQHPQQGRARACWRWMAGVGRRRPNTCTLRSTTVDELRLDDYALSVLAFAAAARLAVHRGDREEADRQLARAMRARPSCTFVLPHVAVRVRLQLAKTYAALADQATARHLLREIDDILAHRPALGALVDRYQNCAGSSPRARR